MVASFLRLFCHCSAFAEFIYLQLMLPGCHDLHLFAAAAVVFGAIIVNNIVVEALSSSSANIAINFVKEILFRMPALATYMYGRILEHCQEVLK